MKTMFRDRNRYRTNFGARVSITAFMRHHYLRLIDARMLVAWFVHRTSCLLKRRVTTRDKGSEGSVLHNRSSGVPARKVVVRDFCKAILQAVTVSHTQARTHTRAHAHCYFVIATIMVIGSLRVTPWTTRYCTRRFSTDTYRTSQNRRKKSGRHYFL